MTGPKLTCVGCLAAFRDADAQRAHYKSDWHRYNLKRKVAGLEPVTADNFNERVIAAKEADREASRPAVSLRCDLCSKSFATKNARDNHINSNRHKRAEKSEAIPPPEPRKPATAPREENDDDDDASSYEEVDDAFPNDCLFCDHHSRTALRNLNHMASVHSFFIPDAEFCTDPEGFISYLGEKISRGFACLWCDEKGKAFQSAEAARTHMRDKGHCKVLHEGEVLAEYVDFYDYSSSYPDHVEGDEDTEVDPDENVLLPSRLDDEEYQLVLPSGALIGHRSLFRYYKQNLSSNGRDLVKKEDKVNRIIRQYRSLGWAPRQNDTILAKKARDVKYMKHVRTKWDMKLGIKANKLQKHFRVQCNF